MNDALRLPRALRPATHGADADKGSAGRLETHGARDIVMVDLNNFATFPTLAIGLLVGALRNKGHRVAVICPLAHDVPATERERQETYLDHLKRRVHLSTLPVFKGPRDTIRSFRAWFHERPHRVVLREVTRALDKKPDVLLLSAYLQHFNTVREIGLLAAARGVPVLLGGPMFNLAATAREWCKLSGIAAVVGAEVDLEIAAMVEAVCARTDLAAFAGVTLPDGSCKTPARPLRMLDHAPLADFTDFPWDRYPVRIVPLMTGRGCQWDKCTFCSDVISASGRSFRTRSVENVLLEMQEQARRHETSNFLFLDLKLNSYPDMIRGIAAEVQRYVQGAEWIGTVHVDQRRDNGLSPEDLRAAVAGGMRRVSFGLESGSQRLLDLMQKGCSVDGNSDFIRTAHEAGLSLRCTMFKGFPGETVEDMEQTADFLERHSPFLDRVRFNEFTLQQDTPIYDAILAKSGASGAMAVKSIVPRRAKAEYHSTEGNSAAYRRAKARALRAVYDINRRPIRSAARQFDGLM